ncbi:MAG: undecaprenyldiphospho-muramoylpentapeptide beta-N-acetylglucosaminyltransferase [Bacillota bacterium]
MRLLVTGGGTGGHIYPALAVADELLKQGGEVLYVGTARGLESDIVPREGIPFKTIPVRGLLNKSPLQAGVGVFVAALGVLEAARIIRRFRPEVVLGTGGYVSGPVVLAARLLSVPYFLQEQNVLPGATNRLMSRWARGVFVPYAECARYFPRRARLYVTGNPIRTGILGVKRDDASRALGLSPHMKTVLVLGGSRGAKTIVDASTDIARELLKRSDAQMILVTGSRYYDRAVEDFAKEGLSGERLRVFAYLYDMGKALAASDLVVCRAGAMTIAEVTSAGLPAVLIPSPNVAGNHQEYNARLLVSEGAAVMIADREAEGWRVAGNVLQILFDEERLSAMRSAARALGRPYAAKRIVEVMTKAAHSI